MKVLYFTKYSRNGASSRLRSYQYFNYLSRKGIEVTVKPFFDEDYLIKLYSNKSISKASILKFYIRRFTALMSVHNYNVIIIEKELFPYFFSWFEKMMFFLRIKYIVDYDDAIFHNYDLSKNKLVRFFLKNKIANVMRYSTYVLAGNEYLASKAKKSRANKIVAFPTVIDINRYKLKEPKIAKNKIVIGWIGSPTTFKYLKNIAPALSRLNSLHPFELHVIGASENIGFTGTVKYPKWSEADETNLLANLDIGIMPLEDSPWELGKCAYKLIQYMGCGLPVVASSIGMNKDIVIDGVNGFLTENDNDWVEKLGVLITNAGLREQFGDAGRKKIELEFSLHNNIKKLIPILKNVRAK